MMSTGLDDMEKVLAQRNRRTKAKASEKVGRDLTYQLFCRVVQVKLACKWWAKRVMIENSPNIRGVVRAIALLRPLTLSFHTQVSSNFFNSSIGYGEANSPSLSLKSHWPLPTTYEPLKNLLRLIVLMSTQQSLLYRCLISFLSKWIKSSLDCTVIFGINKNSL